MKELNEMELDNINGGTTDFYYVRVAGEYKDPEIGTVVKDGYLVRLYDTETDKIGRSIWVAKDDWERFKKKNERQGFEFFQGDPGPKN